MIAPEQWRSLINLKKTDFHNPDYMDWSIVSALDRFIGSVGTRPVIISDYRAPDPNVTSRHVTGKAIDTYWPGADGLTIYQAARAFPDFAGVGLYVNEVGAVSIHVDTTANANSWGGIISHPLDEMTGQHVKRIDYTTVQAVIDWIKKKAPEAATGLSILIVAGVLLWLMFKK